MTYCVYLVCALLVATKCCDALSTAQRIDRATNETNPFARRLMRRHGTLQAIGFVFVLSMLVIGITTWSAIVGSNTVKIAFVFLGLAISYVQAMVAASNWTGRDNAVTRRVHTLHTLLSTKKRTRR